MTGETVEVRTAREADIPRLLEMYEWLFAPPGAPPPDWDPERAGAALAAAISGERSEVIVAARNAELLGFATAYLDLNSVRFGWRCWVEDLAVSPEHRSLGIGKRLLDAAKEWARERGATHLELDSGEARLDAHRFYEREEPSWKGIQYAWLLRPGRSP